METVYFYCAVIGGGILVIQTVMLLFGVGDGDADAALDIDTDLTPMDAADAANSVVLQLSFKTVVAFLTFFGLAGLACLQQGFTLGTTLAVSLAAGFAAFYLVGYLMSVLVSLHSSGNVDLRKAIGSSAKVDLRIPERKSGFGKVTVALQGRTVTQKAVTAGAAIPTGAVVMIDGLTSADTFEVTVRS